MKINIEDLIGKTSHRHLVNNGNRCLTYMLIKKDGYVKTIYTTTNGSTVLYQGESLEQAVKSYNKSL